MGWSVWLKDKPSVFKFRDARDAMANELCQTQQHHNKIRVLNISRVAIQITVSFRRNNRQNQGVHRFGIVDELLHADEHYPRMPVSMLDRPSIFSTSSCILTLCTETVPQSCASQAQIPGKLTKYITPTLRKLWRAPFNRLRKFLSIR